VSFSFCNRPAHADFAKMLKDGLIGLTRERRPVEPIIAQAQHDGPALVEVLVPSPELAMPPTITLAASERFSVSACSKGRSAAGDEIIDLARVNLLSLMISIASNKKKGKYANGYSGNSRSSRVHRLPAWDGSPEPSFADKVTAFTEEERDKMWLIRASVRHT